MLSRERFHLKQPPIDRVQEILAQQLLPEKRLVLERVSGLMSTETLVSELNRARLTVSDSIALSYCKQLIDHGLLYKEKRGLFRPTEIGLAATNALAEYRRSLIDPIHQTRMEMMEGDPSKSRAVKDRLEQEREDMHTDNSFPDPLIAIMANHSRNRPLIMLLSTSLPSGSPVTKEEIEVYARIAYRLNIPAHSLREHIGRLKFGFLISGQQQNRREAYALTNLGVASLEAFDAYQERVASALAA